MILADLSLILFITTLAGLVAVQDEQRGAQSKEVVGTTQAIYRRTGEASLSQWLERQQGDSRLQLTIFAQYIAEDRSDVWVEAQLLAAQAQASGYSPRVVLEPGEVSDVHAVLAYDALN